MQGRRKLKLQIKTSASPTAPRPIKQSQKPPAKKSGKSTTAAIPSTALTSPLTEAISRRQNPANRQQGDARVDDRRYVRNDFVASDDEDDDSYFEPSRDRQIRQETPQLGPPITSDERMGDLSDLHCVFVHQFVEEANKEMEKIRNDHSLKKPIFTDANLREMAINWPITLKEMQEISHINVSSVKTWGKKFLPIIQRYFRNYSDAMAENNNRDIDKNHENVINLCSDDDEDDDEDEFGMNASDEEAILEAEEESKYFEQVAKAFSPKKTGQSNKTLGVGDGTGSRPGPAPKKVAQGVYRIPARGKARKKSSHGRRSASSASGQSHGRPTKQKATAAKKNLFPSKRPSELFNRFGNQGLGGGGGSRAGDGIHMMPT